MNKQEAIEKIKSEKKLGGINSYGLGYNEALDEAVYIVKQLDEPKKPVIPRFVADWIQGAKYNGFDLYEAMTDDEMSDKVATWIVCHPKTFAKAWFFGYEVEKEKLYEVFLKRNGAQLGVCIPDGEDKAQFTEEELKEFEFDNLDVYEVKEVEK